MSDLQDSLNQVYCHFRVGSRGGEGAGFAYKIYIYIYIYTHVYFMVFTGIKFLTMKTLAIKTKTPCSFNFLDDLIFLVRPRLLYSGYVFSSLFQWVWSHQQRKLL